MLDFLGMRVGMSRSTVLGIGILVACAPANPAPSHYGPPGPPAPPPPQPASGGWTWSTDHVACKDIWKTGYACDRGAVAWRACGPVRTPVTYVAGGKRHDVATVCVRCAEPPGAAPTYHPLEAACVTEPNNEHPHHNPFNGMLYIDGAQWEPAGDDCWTIVPPRPPGAPIGTDMIGYRCCKPVIPGSVKPETCGYGGSASLAPSPAPAPPAPPPPSFTCPPTPDHEKSKPRAARKPTIVVDVLDYMTGKGIGGMTVQISHDADCSRDSGCTPTHPHPARLLDMKKKTDGKGRATFAVPDLDYTFHVIGRSPAGYLDYSSIYELGARACHELVREALPGRGDVSKRWVASLVPTSMLSITTPAQAIAIALAIPEIQTWSASHPGITPTARGVGSAWQVVWAVGDRAKRQVHVNAFDGSADVSGRWTD